MSKKHLFFGLLLGLVAASAAFTINRLDLLHDESEDYKEFEGR
jgi:hypothetical protein